MNYEATEPQRVTEKFEECRFRLVEMADCERALDTVKFFYALSAFLSAFRTTAYRLIGVTRSRKGPQAGRELRDKMLAHPDIKFLKDMSDLETHGNGAVVWQRYKVNVGSVTCGRWTRRDDRWSTRYNRSRFESRFEYPPVVSTTVQAVDWQFANRPENLIALCHDALSALEDLIRQSLALSPEPVNNFGCGVIQ
jgi:hypothetical protein